MFPGDLPRQDHPLPEALDDPAFNLAELLLGWIPEIQRT